MDPVKRRQFDSCDPTFVVSIPKAKNEFKNFADFSKAYAPLFESYSRFSKTNNMPSMGDANSDRKSIEQFYNWWYNFDSWRTFHYLDEEGADDGDRRNKRFLDKKNKAEREKRKQADNNQILRFTEAAMKCDPRMIAFKLQKKKEKADSPKPTAAAKTLKESKVVEKVVEVQVSASDLEAKKANAAAKKELKNAKKIFKRLLKDNDYFCAADDAAGIGANITALDTYLTLTSAELLLETSKSITAESLQSLLKNDNK